MTPTTMCNAAPLLAHHFSTSTMEKVPLASKRRRSATRFGAAVLFCCGMATVTLDNSNNNSHASLLIRRSLAANEDNRPKLYALMNIEGIASQKVSLSCHLHLASELGRDLVLLPFRSSHYREGQSRKKHALISLDWKITSTTAPNHICRMLDGGQLIRTMMH